MKENVNVAKEKIGTENLLLYTEALVNIPVVAIDKLPLTGDFEQKILIISSVYPSDSAERILLHKMLAATQLALKDIYILPVSEPLPFLPIINKLKPSKVICFGPHLDSPSLTLSKRLYQLSAINDIELLTTHELAIIVTNNELKQALWNGLKKMFGL